MTKYFFHINITFLSFIINIYFFPLINCGISIAQPEQLANKFFNSEIEAVYGDFGSIYLGFEALGSVWIMPHNENSKTELSPNYACNSLQDIKILKDNYNFANFNVVLVDKGSCSFPKMAKEVEKIGGDMILIINNEPGSISGYKVTNDDGRGSEVSIPVAMISYNDGKAIMDYIINHPKENVYLNIEIGLNQRNKVKIDLFTNIQNQETFQFLSEFHSYFNLLDKFIDMNIYYLTPRLDLLQSQKSKDCINGIFCQKNINTNINSDITGIDLIYESLFHQCMFQKSKKSYFNIISQYNEMCLTHDKFSNFCGLDLFNADMREIIMDCVFNSFGNSDYKKEWEKPQEIKAELDSVKTNTNTILVNNRIKESQLNVNSYPDIYINDIKYEQRFSSMYVFDAVCKAFSPKPEPCWRYTVRPTKLEKKGIPWYDIVLIILGIILINIILYYIIKRSVLKRLNSRINVDKNDLSGQINSVISSYFNLREMNNKHSDDDEDEDTNHKVNNLGDIETFINHDDDNKDEEKEKNGAKLFITNPISEDNNNIDNNKKDEEEKEEKEENNDDK